MNAFLTRTCLFLLPLIAAPAYAVNRAIVISAPTEVAAGSSVTVSISASTDAGKGEEIGFLHADYSVDGGKTWTAIFYSQNAGPEVGREVTFQAGAKGVKSLIRARVAFRGGKDGDVDVTGKAIEWNGSWENWRAPCTKYAIIYVKDR